VLLFCSNIVSMLVRSSWREYSGNNIRGIAQSG